MHITFKLYPHIDKNGQDLILNEKCPIYCARRTGSVVLFVLQKADTRTSTYEVWELDKGPMIEIC